MKLLNIDRTGNRTIFSIFGIKFKHKNRNDDFLENVLKKWETEYNPIFLENYLQNLIKNDISINNKQIFLVYISTLIENKKETEATEFLQNFVQKYGHRDLYEFPVICAFAENQKYADERIKKTAEIFKIMEKNRNNQSLQNLLKNKTVAIVGNSPNLIGKNLGKKIDSHDYVVRFNNFRTENYEQDYGAKTNIWICCQANDIVNLPPAKVHQLDYILYSVDLWHTKLREKCYNNICSNISLETPISYIGSEFKKELKKFGIIYPSSGLQGIYHLMHIADIKRQNIFGFSFLDNNQNYYDHYFSKRSQLKKNKLIRNNHHHFTDEALLLNNILHE